MTFQLLAQWPACYLTITSRLTGHGQEQDLPCRDRTFSFTSLSETVKVHTSAGLFTFLVFVQTISQHAVRSPVLEHVMTSSAGPVFPV